jgi:hypothetical protein
MCSALVVKEEIKKEVVAVEDLARFMKMLDCTDGGPTWEPLMEKSVPGMTYQAWRRDPEVSILYIGCSSSGWCFSTCLVNMLIRVGADGRVSDADFSYGLFRWDQLNTGVELCSRIRRLN